MKDDRKMNIESEKDIEKEEEKIEVIDLSLLSPENSRVHSLKKDREFLHSLVSLGTVKEDRRTPITSGIVIVIYAVFTLKLVVGMLSLKTCSSHGIVPLYLIVAGLIGITIKVLFDTTNGCLFNTLLAMIVFYLIWHVICSYFVFKDYRPYYDPEIETYCSRLSYLVAFWSLMSQYMIFGVFVMLCIFRFFMKRNPKT